MKGGGSGRTDLLRAAVARPILARSLRASLVVGTVLTALHKGDLPLRGTFPVTLWWKVPLTYLVPFLVSTYGALGSPPPSPQVEEVAGE